MRTPTLSPLASSLLVVCCMAPAFVNAMTIDKTVNVNVYQLCTDDGSACANQGPLGNSYYFTETNKIWAQAGISVSFTFIEQIKSSQFYDISDTAGDKFDDLYDFKFGVGMAGNVKNRVDMFLVNNYDGAYGVGYSGAGGLIMAMSTISAFNCGGAAGCTGRVDTLAHELGHNFGLVPEGFVDYAGSSDPGHSTGTNTLMNGGGTRLIPTTFAQIAPDGDGLDLLPQTHIDFARQSSLLSPVPEPTSWAMFAVGLLGIGATLRRRQA